jgi:ferredoxin
MTAMRIHLDPATCQGHGRCYGLAPELFDADEDGRAVLLDVGDVPADLERKAQLAVDNCPEKAIEVRQA